jgi:hypothetical protein
MSIGEVKQGNTMYEVDLPRQPFKLLVRALTPHETDVLHGVFMTKQSLGLKDEKSDTELLLFLVRKVFVGLKSLPGIPLEEDYGVEKLLEQINDSFSDNEKCRLWVEILNCTSRANAGN